MVTSPDVLWAPDAPRRPKIRGRIYALETSYSTTDPDPLPFTGRLIRVSRNGSEKVIDTGGSLFFRTGMTFGPDGELYVSNMGFGPPFGEVLRIQVPDAADDDD